MYGYKYDNHLILNQPMIELWQEENGERVAEVWILPEYGANLCRFKVDGFDYIFPAPEEVVDLRHYGTPVLYPFPGVIKDRKFTFDDTLYRFPGNRGDIFRHGYVMGEKFAFSEPIVADDSVTLKTSIEIVPNHPLYFLFPIINRLDMNFTLRDRKIRIDVKITNNDPQKRFPFGFGLHPYLNILGSKDKIKIQVPMKKWLNQQTGELLDPAESPADLRQPTAIDDLVIDEVWTGMVPDKPQTLTYEEIGKRFVAQTSEMFTHSVIYQPQDSPYICLENWTSAHNVHNLHQEGKTEAAHLIILNPGESISGSVEYRIESI
jgi:aldose 1-epimerase